jgi:hypothetical protein
MTMTTSTSTSTSTTGKGKGKGKPRKPTTHRGVIVWQGASLIDGSPIVVIATMKTSNRKTGDMVQTWILRTDMTPVDAVSTGADDAICGDCPLRGVGGKDRACYVNVGQAPQAVYRAFHRGAYPVFDAEKHGWLFAGRGLRCGAYGDPTASPLDAWLPLIAITGKRRTGYTHQWRNCDQAWREFLMASVETLPGAETAIAAGWRTFRLRRADQPLMAGERVCPASDEGGKRKTCDQCFGCSGTQYGKGGYAIVGHGSAPKLHAISLVMA